MSLLQLFLTFFYVGLFTIGGGVVALTLMQQTIVEKGLIDSNQFFNMVAISESTPGPLGINMATYIGYKLYGVPGGLICTAGEVLPSIIIIIIIAHFLEKYNKNPFVKGALTFLRPATTGLILLPAFQIFIFAIVNLPEEKNLFEILKIFFSPQGFINFFQWINLAAYAVFTFIFFKFKIHPIFIMIAGAVFGIIFL